ncbi:MAG: isoleucine--tRNA ligase [Minisyncoccus archaeiphilus]|uniref:isoleucine--tRNA ligase n=1 Tax=Minisyncoccus archaeiphilus TaxID=3238481 RepID=UPI002B123209|nr:MAG: isoleucine--tRNA ligase [Candidatus Parcubacteria bacterium]
MNKEERILEFWKKEDIFHQSIKNREGAEYYSFYDGPPFATGKPHYGHILATTIKDSVLRYWTMKGYQIPRRVGWDCHGLPIENLIEKEMDIKSKKQIEELGIGKFNDACRSSVFSCVSDFQETLKRVGRWADYSEAYSTMDNNYIESVWWVLKQLWDKELIEKNYRVSPYCPHCATTISNFEVNQGYKEVKDRSIYVRFKTVNDDAYFLVWTTTPWTLPGNLALAIGKDIDYCLIEREGEKLILAKSRLSIIEGEYSIISNLKGSDLIGKKYLPMFDYFKGVNSEGVSFDNAYQVLAGDFVTDEDGTGIVHINPMHGEDDFQISKEHGLPFIHLVDESGSFIDAVTDFPGLFVKDADSKIISYLKEKGILYKEQLISHEYPHCWRCDFPLLYYAVDSWYVLVTKIKDSLVSNNEQINWVPGHLKHGRFGKWLEGARDWDFVRKRYWGAPIPIWECSECKKRMCIGSIAELEEKRIAGEKVSDLHRPFIDDVKLVCPDCGKSMSRIEGVFDCWFESGSMPYAQWHYPFENKEMVERTFPADFIAEGLDQTRGWFYTLTVLATALTTEDIGLGKDKPAFKNVITNGLVLDDKGRKLSKKLKNYPDPKDVFDKYGADSLRYFLLSSTNIGEDYRFSDDKVKEVWRNVVLAVENCFNFYETYTPKEPISTITPSSNVLDKWILGRLEVLNEGIDRFMAGYDLTKATRLIGGGQMEGGNNYNTDDHISWNDYAVGAFIDDLSNWYIRRSRRRFQKPESQEDLEYASQTLETVLCKLTKIMAPFTPFISEGLYQKLRKDSDPISVHLCDYPSPNQSVLDRDSYDIYWSMNYVRSSINLILAERTKAGIKVRQPLASAYIPKVVDGYKLTASVYYDQLISLIKEETNIKEILIQDDIQQVSIDTELTDELREEGSLREIIRHIQQERKEKGMSPEDKISIVYNVDSGLDSLIQKYQTYLLEETLALSISSDEVNQGREIKIGTDTVIFTIKVV